MPIITVLIGDHEVATVTAIICQSSKKQSFMLESHVTEKVLEAHVLVWQHLNSLASAAHQQRKAGNLHTLRSSF